MGVRQLQTFIQHHVPNGYIEVSIHDECEAFKRKNNLHPILVIDLMGLLGPMVTNKKELLCGLRHNEIYKSLEKLLQKLSHVAELIFYEDGPVNDVKVAEWTRRQNERYIRSTMIIDKINQNLSLDDIINSSERDLPSVTSHLIITEQLAMKYGTFKISITRECDSEMAKFACENPRVLAILADDSDFLIYPGNWRYFSLREMNQETLHTMEYNRFALRDNLQLNDMELILLSTLNGNDVIRFDDTFRFHKSLIQQRNNPALRFTAMTDFIKDSNILKSRNLYRDVARLIYGNNSQSNVQKVRESFEFYSIDFEIAEIQGEMNKYCMNMLYDFTFSVLKYTPKTFTVQFVDLREYSNYFDTVSNIFRKQIGIVLRYEQLKGYEVRCKMSHDDTFRSIYLNPIIPTIVQPPLMELLKRSQYPQHDKIRFDLLKWLISEDNLRNVDLMAIPKNIFSDILVLVYIVSMGFISPFEADIILLTIKHVEIDIVPENLTTPDYLHPRAFFISFLFSKFYTTLSRSLEVTGLKNLLKINNFDGVLFHNLYLMCLNQPFNMSFLLGDYTKHRYYNFNKLSEMGIRQLQTFIQKYVPNGYIDVSLHDECEQFSRENEARPILLIDLHGLLRPLVTDPYEIFCGIRHNIVYEKLEKFLKKLSQIAVLIFFSDGPVTEVKLPKWMEKQNSQYEKLQSVMDKINERHPLKEIISKDQDLMSPTSHLKLVKHVAKLYGTLIYGMDRECDLEMAKFACENPRVLAILADDSDFLIFPGNWRYFSIRDLNQETLDTKEYSRVALRKTLKLNDKELVILSTLHGNDVISYDDTFRFHKSLIHQRNNPALRFPAIAQYIKERQLVMSRNMHSLIAYAIFRSNYDSYVKKIKDSIEFYDINFKVPKLTDPTEIFLRENRLNFSFMILKHIPQTFTLNFFDVTRSDNYFESINKLFSKHIGIILNDNPLQNYKIVSKMSFNDAEYTSFKVDKAIPTCKVPQLTELFDRSQHPEHDKTRIDLLKWLISEEKLNDVNLESIPINILLDILALTFMVNEGFIDVIEADIILLSIKQVQDKAVPENLKAPEILHPRAFTISILFSKCHFYATRSLEVTGLKELKKVLNFDGVLFHNLFHKHINKPFNTSEILTDLAQYRYYA
ncbi:uncharacterized protein [Chironomus tepperi]|uniref:uncharacterized protein n=1 Tax=Chironomus tepperi TaxID=113505 RepID=UPI00391FABB8